MYFQRIVKADKKKSQVNSNACSNVYTKVPKKAFKVEFPSWEILLVVQEPNVAHVSKECAVEFESKKIEHVITVFDVRFEFDVTKAIRKIVKI